MNTKLSFNEYAEAFKPYSQLESASFVQGMLVGQLCSTPSITEAQWIKRLVDEAGMGAIKESFLVALHQLYMDTLAGLNSAECDFEMLMPADDDPLAQRARHLAEWCEGFLYGMGLGSLGELSREVSELLNDFGEISLLEVPDEPDDKADDNLTELVEFVRMGAIMVYDELNPIPQQPIPIPDTDKKPTLH